MTHEDYMRQALDLARSCLATGDVPVGCVVVSPAGEVIGRGRNRREAEGSAAAHAEVEAITQACRAVGMANHNNPISIIVPCHRVVGADGSLTGYGGGLAAKEFLLALEQGGRPS